MERNLFVWDTANGQLEEIGSFADAKKFIEDCYTDSCDGLHPDIESVMILEQVGGVTVTDTGRTTEMNGEQVPVCDIDIYLSSKSDEQDWPNYTPQDIDIIIEKLIDRGYTWEGELWKALVTQLMFQVIDPLQMEVRDLREKLNSEQGVQECDATDVK